MGHTCRLVVGRSTQAAGFPRLLGGRLLGGRGAAGYAPRDLWQDIITDYRKKVNIGLPDRKLAVLGPSEVIKSGLGITTQKTCLNLPYDEEMISNLPDNY